MLYPNDEQLQGKELRLEQQYFFVSCSLQDMMRIAAHAEHAARALSREIRRPAERHPSGHRHRRAHAAAGSTSTRWTGTTAWTITRQTFGYTNHTLLPEALESWPLALFGRVLPRHLEIIYEINARFLEEVRMRFPGDDARIARMSLIDETGERYVRMANLASVGSHAINGVAAAAHRAAEAATCSRISTTLWPEKFSNKTNGVTPRRWMALANPRLAESHQRSTSATGWIKRPVGSCGGWSRSPRIPRSARAGATIKHANKSSFAALALERTGVTHRPESLFDVQVKRIHEYKRQHLNVLHVVALYHRLEVEPAAGHVSRAPSSSAARRLPATTSPSSSSS